MGCCCPKKNRDSRTPKKSLNDNPAYPDLNSNAKMKIKKEMESDFVEIPLLEAIDRKLNYAIDEAQGHTIEQSRQILHSARFELQSYLNYFDLLIGGKELVTNDDLEQRKNQERWTNSAVVPFSIEVSNPQLRVRLLDDMDYYPNNTEGRRSVRNVKSDADYEISDDMMKESLGKMDKKYKPLFSKNSRLFLIEVQRAKYLAPISELQEYEMKGPRVELTVRTSMKTSSETTTPQEELVNPVWNQFYIFELEFPRESAGGSLDLEGSAFTVKLLYEQKNRKTKVKSVSMLGQSYSFSMKELDDQRVHDKTLTIKNLQTRETFAQLSFRSQLIYDYEKLYKTIRKDVEVRQEAIQLALKDLNNPPAFLIGSESIAGGSMFSQVTKSAFQAMSLVDPAGLGKLGVLKGGRFDNEFYVQ